MDSTSRNSVPLSAVILLNTARNARVPIALSMDLKALRTDACVQFLSLRTRTRRVLRSVRVINTSLLPSFPPTTRSISQWPKTTRASTSSGRSSMFFRRCGALGGWRRRVFLAFLRRNRLSQSVSLLTPGSSRSDGVFDEVIVDFQRAVFQVAVEFVPSILRVADRFTEGA